MTAPSKPVCIVTGASSGVGRATAVLMAEYGHAVVLVGRDETKLRETVDLIKQDADPDAAVLIRAVDLTAKGAAQGVVDATLERFGKIDAVCNVAGSAPLQAIPEVTSEVFDDAIAINLKAPTLLIAACWPHLAKQQGTIVSISSLASVDPFVGFNIYGAAKAGINLLTKALSDEGEKAGIKAVAIAPGAIETPMLRQNFPASMLPPDKCLSAEQVGAVVRDCVTGLRTFESGETILLPSP